MKDDVTPLPVSRADYVPFNFLVEEVSLRFELDGENTQVQNRLSVRRNEMCPDTGAELVLDGQNLVLLELLLNGDPLVIDVDYRIDVERLVIHRVPDNCEISIRTGINPLNNTALEGLYQSSGNYCTQCEAEGFSRITYFPDRPDVMSLYEVTIIARKDRFPVLLSNGNEIDSGDMDDGRHWVKWRDPFPKPCYLFALVAGDLSVLQDSFTTISGRSIDLRIYVESHNIDKCEYAMASLIRAMKWDEEVYGLEYDLDIYMIVAVDDFNMGAMENKGLNIFNSKYVLANQSTATDTDFQGVESVVAHEYFHNWTGNRVTCRDWFQLSLKEGLTVFRDQEFSADLNSRAVKRIEDVRLLRNRQFPEDSGPMAHPIRPDSYIEINNFYTVTVYEKGAEVIRMMHTILGPEKFRTGIDLYFERHDGQAVTCEDFVCAMEASSGSDLSQFRYWYSQAGTPTVKVKTHYDQEAQTYKISLSQSSPDTPDQTDKNPLHIPFTIALFDSTGTSIALQCGDKTTPTERVLNLTSGEQEFVFTQVHSRPIPSMLRGFSAPVILDYQYEDEDLAFLFSHDSDAFSRWEAGQLLAISRLEQYPRHGGKEPLDRQFIDAFESMLRDKSLDAALRAEMLRLPSIDSLVDRHEQFDIDTMSAAHRWLRRGLARGLQSAMHDVVTNEFPAQTDFSVTADSIGQRALRNTCLAYLVLTDNPEWQRIAGKQFETASTMTDQIAALGALIDCSSEQSNKCLQKFYNQWRDERLVIDKWFSLQAMADSPDVLAKVKSLMQHQDFDLANPNRARSLIGAFSQGNPVHFHAADGSGYRFLCDCVLKLDDINPQTAARLASPLIRWRRFDPQRQKAMLECLRSITRKGDLSNDVYEISCKGLQGNTVLI